MPADGVLVIDKPKGVTSRSVTTKIKKLLEEKKTGHIGTLDPLATGVLPVALGKATRLVRFLEKGDKEYIANVMLGVTTGTLDAEGEVIERREVSVSEDEIRRAVEAMTGGIEQVVPQYSAAKHKGKPLYEYARKGHKVSPRTKKVVIHEIQVERVEAPEVRIRVRCSPGTYIRTLAADLGERLGCGAHLAELRRTRSGDFTLGQAVPLDELSEQKALSHILPLQSLLPEYPEVTLSGDQSARIRDGKTIPAQEFPDVKMQPGERYRLTHEKVFAVAECMTKEDKISLKPLRVIQLD